MKSVSSGFVFTSPRSAFCADVIFGGNCDENVGGSEAPSTRDSSRAALPAIPAVFVTPVTQD